MTQLEMLRKMLPTEEQWETEFNVIAKEMDKWVVTSKSILLWKPPTDYIWDSFVRRFGEDSIVAVHDSSSRDLRSNFFSYAIAPFSLGLATNAHYEIGEIKRSLKENGELFCLDHAYTSMNWFRTGQTLWFGEMDFEFTWRSYCSFPEDAPQTFAHLRDGLRYGFFVP